MSALVLLMLLSTPPFEPVRGHAWGETIETSFAVESEQADSRVTHLLTSINGTHDASRPPFLHYTFSTAVPFEFVALDFETSRLSRILYPLHLPSSTPDIEKPATDVPEKFQAVRAWLTEHLGEPDVFTTSISGHTAYFTDIDSLLEIDAYLFNYTWCSQAANAYLIALRETGKSPVLVATLSPPDVPAHAGAAVARSGCAQPVTRDDKKPKQAPSRTQADSLD